MTFSSLRSRPFNLSPDQVDWVKERLRGLSLRGKLAQLMVPLVTDRSDSVLESLCELGVGGLFRLPGGSLEALRSEALLVQEKSDIPLLMAGDLEFNETHQIGTDVGTNYPNQMTVGATGDTLHAERMARVAAREGLAAGFNWSLTPLVDLNRNQFNALVNTRAFGDDANCVSKLGVAYVRAMQAEGMIACAKHWPGDGIDDRDQHLVTSVNSLDLKDWKDSFGRVYRSMIRNGVLSIMSAHISLPAYPGAGYKPASLSYELNEKLLRKELKFKGLIVSDASVMAGVSSQGKRENLVPTMVKNGCDVVLFPEDVELEIDYLKRSVDSGDLSESRIDESVTRVLALKASIGLDKKGRGLGRTLSKAKRSENQRWSKNCAQKSVTLLKDSENLLPISSKTHRRVLLIQQDKRRNTLGPLPTLGVKGLLEKEGFSVELFTSVSEPHADYFDLIIYAVGEEGFYMRQTIPVPWLELHKNVFRMMDRFWHEVPSVFISFGNPYHIREVPTCPVYINAYSPVASCQEAAVKALVGKVPFAGKSPVDLSHCINSEEELKPFFPS
ncbi:glycoside hydrolase family 3 protein [Pelagicoccus albus]|nr:glycoside hydrolase family 3 N-terminal domain-containing protein [Pelagicoccus albus]